MQTDVTISLPPQIPISQDGEEGYQQSQKTLKYLRKSDGYQHCFRPPPNKTVHDKESPPPYYSHSASALDKVGHSPLKVGGSPNSRTTSSEMLSRSYSMSNSNHYHDPSVARTNNSNMRGSAAIHQELHTSNFEPPNYHTLYNTFDDKV